jgi:two-component system cell cycle response regulator
MRLLVADDDPVLRRILRAALTRAGHDVQEATDGRAAWGMLQAEPARLLITDWMMPEMDGPELIRHVRAAAFPGYTYIILLTARGGKKDIVSGLEAGADDYLSKPFNPDELRARVAIGERILDLEARLSDARDQLEVLAMQDSLTGLLNRRAIMEHAQAELQRAQRDGAPLSFIMLDVDHFKSVNDRYGHLVGDQVLRMIAGTLTSNKRGYDWAGRWGGEEFLLVIPGTTAGDAVAIAERLRAGVAAATLPLANGEILQVYISIGVTNVSACVGGALDALLQQADLALYRAKREGRNRVCLYQPDARDQQQHDEEQRRAG